MTFEKISDDERIWAVKYDSDKYNILDMLFYQWDDVLYLRDFFKSNFKDLQYFFHITDIDKAIDITIKDSDILQEKVLYLKTSDDAKALFRHLDDEQIGDRSLDKNKINPKHFKKYNRFSWLRLYAIKLSDNVYVFTGGAIKLTPKMEDRIHTKKELLKLDMVRNFLLSNGVVDSEGFKDLVVEINN